MPAHRILLLGLGFWGERWLKALAAHPRCTVAGVTAGAKTLEKICREHRLSPELGHIDYREAIARTDADIVVISLPTDLHRDAAELALAKGMHVICEKPLALNRAEAEAIRRAKAKRPKSKFMVSQNYRWRPHNQTIKQAIRQARIGQIGSVHVEFRQPECFIGYREFLPRPLLQDVCIHHFDLIRFFTGQNCQKVFAANYRPAWSRHAGSPSTEAIMHLDGGIVANYHGTWATRGRETSWDGNITITGDQGSLVLDAQDQVRFYAPEAAQGELLKPVAMAATEIDYALATFLDCIERDLVPETDLEDICASFAMVCAAEASVASGASASAS